MREWVETTVGDIDRRKSQNIKPEEYPEETFELYSVPTFPTGEPELVKGKTIKSSKQVVQEGDVLLCKINPRINRVWQVGNVSDARKIASSEWIVVRPDNNVMPEFLRYQWSAPHFRELMCQDVSGVGGSLTRARPKIVKTYPTLLTTEDNQHQIVAHLDAFFARHVVLRSSLSRLPALVADFREAVLRKAVTGALTEEWRKENTSIEAIEGLEEYPMRRPGFTLPDIWQWQAFKSVASIDSNLVDPDEYPQLPIIAPDVIEQNTGRLLNKPLVSEVDPKSNKHLFRKGAIVYSKIRPYLNKLTLVDFEGVCSADMYPISTVLRSEFLFFYMLSPVFLRFSTTAGARTVLPKINQKGLNEIPVPVPPLEEQREIVRRIESLFAIADRLEERIAVLQRQVEDLPQAVLGEVFGGRG